MFQLDSRLKHRFLNHFTTDKELGYLSYLLTLQKETMGMTFHEKLKPFSYSYF